MQDMPQSLSEMVRTESYHIYESETVMNTQYRTLNPGLYGDVECVTHQEVIECFRDYLEIIQFEVSEEEYDKLDADIDSCEEWHITNKSISHMAHDLSGDAEMK